MSFVPFPWWTSQSTIITRSTAGNDRACRAATAMLLNRQKPHRTRGERVVAGWRCALNPDGADPSTRPVDQPDRAAGGVECSRVRPLRRRPVSMSIWPPPGAPPAPRSARRAPPDERGQRLHRHRRRGHARKSEPPSESSFVLDRDDPRRLLGVAAGVVLERRIGGTRTQARRHREYRIARCPSATPKSRSSAPARPACTSRCARHEKARGSADLATPLAESSSLLGPGRAWPRRSPRKTQPSATSRTQSPPAAE